ncbi:MAG: arginine deiminase [Nitriliruptorales bacterium]|nr:arginine deiminase [Nitriliruptorales bacterium]
MSEPIAPSIRSEVAPLQAVMLHRPGEELRRLTPSNKDELLFDELLWVERAQEEHDAFAETLRSAGATVLYVEELLAEVLSDDDVARDVIQRHVSERTCGPTAVERVRSFLAELAPTDLVGHLIGGVSIEEVGPTDGLVAAVTGPSEMLLDPLPNAVFMRDSSAWIADGVVLSPMSRLVRRRETDLLRLVYTQHPAFADTTIWFGAGDEDHFPATFEGGDVLVVGERGLAIGISERTTPSGVETLATRLFAAGVVDRILAVDLPKVRAAMHLDTIVTQVDVDAFLTYPAMTPSLRCYELRPGGDGIRVEDADGLLAGLAWAAGLDDVRGVEPSLQSTRAEREQWNDANNTLAVAPGEVIAYERNVATNAVLADAGITVHTIPSYELPRGRGGPRCMSCPLRREPG